jgi:hypothetical protein
VSRAYRGAGAAQTKDRTMTPMSRSERINQETQQMRKQVLVTIGFFAAVFIAIVIGIRIDDTKHELEITECQLAKYRGEAFETPQQLITALNADHPRRPLNAKQEQNIIDNWADISACN